ncbi:hypothetical protein VMCG_09484 [Cytospora schulzeri]|uniref:Uncharacterized protein n=1 Tax=Cytospora schulzeri TaxID=448051 RepID=A0A423VFV3_9PEZI|nr:hypothetical protein VMCG_09484 [Valsa malicola]
MQREAIQDFERNNKRGPFISMDQPNNGCVFITSCEEWLAGGFVGKSATFHNVMMVINLDHGLITSHIAAMDTAILDLNSVDKAVRQTGRGTSTQASTCKIGDKPRRDYSLRPVQGSPGTVEFDEATREETVRQLEDAKLQMTQQGLARHKTVILMCRDRFQKAVASLGGARSHYIHSKTPAADARKILQDGEPGFTVIGIALDVCILPRIRGLRQIIVDPSADTVDFDDRIGECMATEQKLAMSLRMCQVWSMTRDDDPSKAIVCLFDIPSIAERPQPQRVPALDTAQLFHYIIDLARIWPGRELQHVPCPGPFGHPSRYFERVRRLRQCGLIECKDHNNTLKVSPKGVRGQTVARFAPFETNIHCLLLIASVASPEAFMSDRARYVLVRLAAIIAHDPTVLLLPPEMHTQSVQPQSTPTPSSDLGFDVEAPQNTLHAVDPVEAHIVLDRIDFWLEKLALPKTTMDIDELSTEDMGAIGLQLVRAFIYNIGIDENVFFVIYTELQRKPGNLGPRNITIVPDDAVYNALVEFAPGPGAPPDQAYQCSVVFLVIAYQASYQASYDIINPIIAA